MAPIHTRRQVIGGIAAAASVGLVGMPAVRAAEGALETTAVRFGKIANVCFAPQYAAEELLRAEGFSDIRYVELPPGRINQAIGRGEIDFSMGYASQHIASIDAGEPLTVLAGVMVGCIELFVNRGIQGVADLKGRKVGVPDVG